MNKFDITWHRFDENEKYVVGILTYIEDKWLFNYNHEEIEKALEKGFRPFPEMPCLNKTYESKTLFKTFSIRIKGIEDDYICIMQEDQPTLATDNIGISRIKK